MYEIIIGLEIHLQPKTKSKMFCPCSADYFGDEPNTHTCPVCLGLPGALPVPNQEAIEKCIKLGLALDCKINTNSKFDRKNYFYPDLPKGYQISQYDIPFCYNGFLEIDVAKDSRRIRITRIHMEEDTGKSMHTETDTLLDFNKSGMPLIEIVTEADFTEVGEVLSFAKRLRQIVRYLDISDADMEKGQMRYELNMSLREEGATGFPPYKVEVKNISSISVLEKIIKSEYMRQSNILSKGAFPKQETRGLVDMSGETVSLRTKETADDYRYFPEPDIPLINISVEKIEELKSKIGELPHEKKYRYMNQYGLEPDTAEAIIVTRAKAEWFEQCVEGLADNKLIREIAKWYVGELYFLLKADSKTIVNSPISPLLLRELVQVVYLGELSNSLGKQVLAKMYKTGKEPRVIMEEEGIKIVADEGELSVIVAQVIAANPQVTADITKNPNAVKFLLGQVMKETRGQADHNTVQKLLDQQLFAK